MTRRRGFTLMELLIVIAIIGVLVALLMPTFTAVRKAAQGARCMSNMSAIGRAWHLYLIDNKGATPMTGDGSVASRPEDWLHWQPTRKLDDSAFAKYLGKPLNRDLLICPLDDPLIGARTEGSASRYEYSYSMNVMMANYPVGSAVYVGEPEILHNMKLSKIKNPATKIVIAEESFQSINDTAWAPKIMSKFPRIDWTTNRHGVNRDKVFASSQLWNGTMITDGELQYRKGLDIEGLSNAIFGDGHAERVTRRFAHSSIHFDPAK